MNDGQKRAAQKLAMITGAMILAACSNQDPILTQFYREAGALPEPGSLGDSTINNVEVLNGTRQVTAGIANRFENEIESTVNFPFNSDRLDGQAKAILRQQASWIRQFPEVRFRVFGHTDLVGSNAYNQALGKRRADAVVRFLTAQGISQSRLEAVASFGETRPVIVTQDKERANRRTVTEVSGLVSRHPNVLDGKYAQIIYRDYIASAVPPTQLSQTTLGQEE